MKERIYIITRTIRDYNSFISYILNIYHRCVI